MATYLLTGAAGFIASKVADLLLEAGHTVVGVDNLNDAYDVRLKHWRLERLLKRPGFIFQPLDITSRPALQALGDLKAASEAEAVINLAARAGVRPSVTDPWVYYDTNLTGTLNLLEWCRARGIGKFVLASTSSLYGARNPMPYREDADTDHPLSPYAASKKAAETLCYTYHTLHRLDVTVFRYFTVYGPAGRPDMSLFRFVQWISEGRPVVVFGDGRQSRDFTYVDDIARGTILGLQPVGYEVINLGSDRPAILMQVIHMIEQRLGRVAELVFKPAHPADVPATWADIRKAQAKLAWAPQMTLEHGVEALIDWYQANRAWAAAIDTG